MRLIAITAEQFISDEPAKICHLLDNGFCYAHLRKPGGSDDDMRNLIQAIPPCYHSRLTLASNLGIFGEFSLGGVHLNNANLHLKSGFKGVRISKSSHCEADLLDLDEFHYSFISPVFSSISKAGYQAAFSSEDLKRILATDLRKQKLVALGGVTPENLPRLASLGFTSAAMLGAIWQNFDNLKIQ